MGRPDLLLRGEILSSLVKAIKSSTNNKLSTSGCERYIFISLCTPGVGAETQHHPADVRGEGRGGWGAAPGPGGREEHVQNPDRRVAEKSKIDSKDKKKDNEIQAYQAFKCIHCKKKKRLLEEKRIVARETVSFSWKAIQFFLFFFLLPVTIYFRCQTCSSIYRVITVHIWDAE